MGKREELAKLQSQRGIANLSGINNPNAIDMFIGEENINKQDELKVIPIDKLQPFKNHIFHLYEGERLDEMVNSIRMNGVITPIIVRPMGNDYEILAGHNRENAGKLAELTEIPAIIKYGLTDEEAELITITTNLNQRSIEYMKISELAFALRRQNELLKHQGKRNDLTFVPMEQKSLREKIGQEFKLSQSNVQRYVRLTYLNPELLQLVDDKKLNFRSSVEISYLKPQEMTDLYEYITDYKANISVKIAEELKKLSQSTVDNIDIKNILNSFNKPEDKKLYKISNSTIKKIADIIPSEDKNRINEIIIMALNQYYKA